MEKTIVLISKMPFETDLKVHCSKRQEYIDGTTHPVLKQNRFFVWKLFERALDTFGIDPSTAKFSCANGKWLSEQVCFSLSHTSGVCAVAVSHSPVGVDVEVLNSQKLLRVAKKVLTQTEYQFVQNATDGAMQILDFWTKKEAIFKSQTAPNFVPDKIETALFETATSRFEVDGKTYSLSVTAKNPTIISYI